MKKVVVVGCGSSRGITNLLLKGGLSMLDPVVIQEDSSKSSGGCTNCNGNCGCHESKQK